LIAILIHGLIVIQCAREYKAFAGILGLCPGSISNFTGYLYLALVIDGGFGGIKGQGVINYVYVT
jgi:hypothetical protein